MILTSGAGPLEVILAVLPAILGALFLGAGMSGFFTTKLSLVARLLVIPGGFLLLLPGWQTSLVGIALIALALLGDILARPILLRRKVATGSETHIKPPGTYIDSPDV